jgi:hypothetical protein
VEEPVLAGFSLAATGAFDETDDPGVRTSVIGLPRRQSLLDRPADDSLGDTAAVAQGVPRSVVGARGF